MNEPRNSKTGWCRLSVQTDRKTGADVWTVRAGYRGQGKVLDRCETDDGGAAHTWAAQVAQRHGLQLAS